MDTENSITAVAQAFGTALDRDDFAKTEQLLDPACTYDTGKDLLEGATTICKMYEDNMLAGRKKFDRLEWGQSEAREEADGKAGVYFTDYLSHKGIDHVYRCKQELTFNDALRIQHIKHVELEGEREKLDAFLEKTELK